ncbi:hypothetical protein EHV15_13490 [Paenibacillus oralis]|uniref:HipA-like C-terminal domain-containing protein n=1 Tax=Paenibacillus oralis TaxID=2490856 RepID=A0A3P3U0D9_9BACL|nr:HipA domain-containing protein [Paenibacillus oralis]RRJ63827.1 hypothetical protein EHV15_13490 [Paenibacillus oralis]
MVSNKAITKYTEKQIGNFNLDELHINHMNIPQSRREDLKEITASTLGVFPKFVVNHSSDGKLHIKAGELIGGGRYSVNQPIVERIVYLMAKRLGIECSQVSLWLIDRRLIVDDQVTPRELTNLKFESAVHYSNKILTSVTRDFLRDRDFYHMSSFFPDKQNYEFVREQLPEHVKHKLDRMVLLDTLVANSDRHNRNVGFFVSSRSGNVVIDDLAPLYDHGLSLASEVPEEVLREEGHDIFISFAPQPFKESNLSILRSIANSRKISGVNFGVSSDELLSIVERYKPVMNSVWYDLVNEFIYKRWGYICEIFR